MPETDENEQQNETAAEQPVMDAAPVDASQTNVPETADPATADVEHATAPEAPDAALVEGVSGGVSWIPFGAYLGCWLILAGLSAYFLRGATPESPAQWMPAYEPLLWGGLGLTAIGPLMSLAVWIVARARRSAGARRGLFAAVMTRGALTEFFGVLLWLGTLFVLELLASGRAL